MNFLTQLRYIVQRRIIKLKPHNQHMTFDQTMIYNRHLRIVDCYYVPRGHYKRYTWGKSNMLVLDKPEGYYIQPLIARGSRSYQLCFDDFFGLNHSNIGYRPDPVVFLPK